MQKTKQVEEFSKLFVMSKYLWIFKCISQEEDEQRDEKGGGG